jgi:ABC-2 type transport system ATP-binding protein
MNLPLAEIKNVSSVKKIHDNVWLIEAEGDEDIRPFIFNFAVKNNLTVLYLNKQENNLEDVFRHLTNG